MSSGVITARTDSLEYIEAASLLRKISPDKISQTFFSFLETYAQAPLRDRKDSDIERHFTILDAPLKIKKALLKNEKYHHNNLIQTRFFTEPNEEDIAGIHHYQEGRVDPNTFMPLDLLAKGKYGFIASEVRIQMGDKTIPVGEYLFSCDPKAPNLTTALENAQKTSATVLLRHMDKKYISVALVHIAKIFERIVTKTPDSLDAFKTDLAELTYTFRWVKPLENRNGDFARFLQNTLAAFHGLTLTAPQNNLSFTYPHFPDFLKKFIAHS